MNFLNDIDHHLYPISIPAMAALCGVTERTVRRWISGESKPPKSAFDLIWHTARGRIMPRKWPAHWTINSRGYLDIGHSKALAWQQIDWYFYSVVCWRNLLDTIPYIEARLEAAMKTAPKAVVIDLQKYKDELEQLKKRPFLLPDDLLEYYQIGEKETHRKVGC